MDYTNIVDRQAVLNGLIKTIECSEKVNTLFKDQAISAEQYIEYNTSTIDGLVKLLGGAMKAIEQATTTCNQLEHQLNLEKVIREGRISDN